MSYLNGTRITFSGRFFADVPTVNNDPGAFEPGPIVDPLWNRGGGGTFDFLGCRVNGGEHPDGNPIGDQDPATGLAVVGAADRPGAKLVDLDPRWQMSSEIWALQVRLVDPGSGEELVSGSFRVSGFRDVWTRQTVEGGNGQQAGASFVSVLDDVTYGPRAATSAALSAIRAESDANRLSIVLNTFGYYYAHVDALFGTGSLTGCIGPWRDGEPARFAAGRRIDAGVLARPGPDPILLAWSVASVDEAESRIVLDLGNAYPIVDPVGTPATLAALSTPQERMVALELAILASETVTAGAIIAADDGATAIIGTVDLADAPAQSGVYSFALAPAVAAVVAQRPLGLVVRRQDGTRRVVGRETADGLYVRVDDFVHRIEARGNAKATVYALRRGVPAPEVTIHLAPVGTPPLLTVPSPVRTGPAGNVEIPLTAGVPPGAQDAIDGEIARVRYSPRLRNGSPDPTGTGLTGLDVIVAHVRDPFVVPDRPDWDRHVKPILTQYARLYPIMSEHLVDLGDRDALPPWRRALLFAMTRKMGDPNYMPVTRDLSEPKQATIVRWLEQLPAAGGRPPDRPGDRRRLGLAPSDSGSPPADRDVSPVPDAKSAAAAEIGRQVAARLGTEPEPEPEPED